MIEEAVALVAAVVRQVDELGRVVLPIEIRRRLGIGPGTKLAIHVEDDGVIVLQPAGATPVERLTKVLQDVEAAVDTHLAGGEVDWRAVREAIREVLRTTRVL